MSKILVIAEKPSVARELGKILECNKRGQGFLTGKNYIVTWAVGHLITLYEPGDYHVKFKSWAFNHLPIIPEQIQLKPNKQTEDQYEIVKTLIQSDEVTELICATDSGREGELIFRYIYHATNCTKPFQRLWISSMTEKAIRTGFKKLKPGSDYDNLYASAKSRSEADWLVGINATRAFTIQYDTLLSVGRVQSPTLALIVNRQKEIDEFDSRPYWEINIDTGEMISLWTDLAKNDSKLFDEEKSKEIAKKVKGQDAIVQKIEKENKSQPAPLLYDLTELQRDANKKFGFTAKKTLSLAQDLYEKHKVVTYPRTDSRYLSDDMIPVLNSTLKKLAVPPFKPYADYLLSLEKLPISKRIVDNKKVSDHHAIIPTDSNYNISRLNKEEKQLFYMIVRRFLAVFYPKHEYSTTKIVLESCNENFVTRGKTINKWGWMEFYKSDDQKSKKKEEQQLPNLTEGDILSIKKIERKKKKTNPPRPYTEASLLSAMENAGRFVDDEELKESLKDSGLGTPATRASIIERLIQVNYILRNGKALQPTAKGKKIIQIIPEALSSPEFTGKWEKGLTQIAKGEVGAERFMTGIKKYVQQIIAMAQQKNPNIVFENTRSGKPSNKPSLGKCKSCADGEIFENKKAFYCSNWRKGCKFNIWKNQFENHKIPYTEDFIKKLIAENEIPKIKATFKDEEEKIVTVKLMDNGRIRFVPESEENQSHTNPESNQT